MNIKQILAIFSFSLLIIGCESESYKAGKQFGKEICDSREGWNLDSDGGLWRVDPRWLWKVEEYSKIWESPKSGGYLDFIEAYKQTVDECLSEEQMLMLLPDVSAEYNSFRANSDATISKITFNNFKDKYLEIDKKEFKVGDFIGGGVVFYVHHSPKDLDGDGDLDMVLICAPEDQSLKDVPFYNDAVGFSQRTITGGAEITGERSGFDIYHNRGGDGDRGFSVQEGGDFIGAGAVNTRAIIAMATSAEKVTGEDGREHVTVPEASHIAVSIASNYNGGGYSDWFLPSQYELKEIFLNRKVINKTALAYGYGVKFNLLCESDIWEYGVFTPPQEYWSSTQNENQNGILSVYYMDFGTDSGGNSASNFPARGRESDLKGKVRAIRAF